ncbi:hypothetical protein E3J79_02765 [Candidatus Dependentiae bacterium]|nr:MAG: hypothetical protein E3J79_02765 [Candidatus Dependentiae bacterium]
MGQNIIANIFRVIGFNSFILIFLSGHFLIKGSHPPTERSAHFILYLDDEAQEEQIKDLLESLLKNNIKEVLNLKGAHRDIILGPENTEQEIIKHIERNPEEPVIIAMGARASIIAKTTQILEKEGKRKIHTIILFDPTVVEWKRKQEEWFSRWHPIEFNYNCISNRIYNFYSESKAAPSGYRKITPALGIEPAPSHKLYLKAVNMKCLYNTPQCIYNALPFFREDSTFTNEFQFSIPLIPKAIELANEKFKINTDLLCVLFNQQCPHPAIPDKDLPFLFINRFTELKENYLEYIVAKAKLPELGLKWLSNDYIWTSENLSAEQKEQIELELNREAGYNAFIQAEAPDLTIRKGIMHRITEGWTKKLIIDHLWKWFKEVPAIRDNPHKGEFVQVYVGNDLCVEENNYLKNRYPKVKKALESLLRRSLTGKVLTIAVVCSGGGIRATLTTLGFLRGLKKIGLLDAVTYICTLSGSTWAVGPWMSSVQEIEDVQARLIERLPRGFVSAELNTTAMINALLVKWSFEQPITLVDWYGVFLANMLLPNQDVYLSKQHDRIKNGDLPFPIYTAVDTDEKHWYEFTPYEVGGAWLGHYIKSWAFGRKFAYGFSQDQAPEQSFGFFMGIFGSAFAATFGRIYNRMVNPKTWTGTILSPLLENSKKRPSQGEVFNFTYGMPESSIKNKPYMKMVDAGLDFNLPYPPISGERPERKADIIIFVDASKTPRLNTTEEYARMRKLPFPSRSIYYDRTISVYEDKDCPTVIYMPLFQDKDLIENFKEGPEYKKLEREAEFIDLMDDVMVFVLQKCMETPHPIPTCSTFNFQYPAEDARRLSSLAEFNVRANRVSILDAINRFITKIERQELVKASRNSNLTVCSKDKNTISPSVGSK